MKHTKKEKKVVFKTHPEIPYLLGYDKRQSMISMPNEILTDLHPHIETSSHVAFAYSYYYLYTYLWRYAKFVTEENHIFGNQDIRYILGYNPTNQRMNYITKEDGILDRLGYTKQVNDIPLFVNATLADIEEDFHIEYKMYHEFREDVYLDFKQIYHKYPIKAFHRTRKSLQDNILDGTFYEYKDFHCIHPSIFVKCMTNYEELGTQAFYMYGMIKRFNYGNAWIISKENMIRKLRVSPSTYYRYRDALEKHGMIEIVKYDYMHNDDNYANEYMCVEKVYID